MTNSFWFSFTPSQRAGALQLVALPRWAELSLQAVGSTPDQAAALRFNYECYEDFEERARSILSSKEVGFHDDVQCALDAYLFGDVSKMGDWFNPAGMTEEQVRAEMYKVVVQKWFAIPLLSDGFELNLHPFIIGGNLIALVHTDPIPGVTDTNLYERLLRCVYAMSVSKIGLQEFDTDLFRKVLSGYMEHKTSR